MGKHKISKKEDEEKARNYCCCAWPVLTRQQEESSEIKFDLKSLSTEPERWKDYWIIEDPGNE